MKRQYVPTKPKKTPRLTGTNITVMNATVSAAAAAALASRLAQHLNETALKILTISPVLVQQMPRAALLLPAEASSHVPRQSTTACKSDFICFTLRPALTRPATCRRRAGLWVPQCRILSLQNPAGIATAHSVSRPHCQDRRKQKGAAVNATAHYRKSNGGNAHARPQPLSSSPPVHVSPQPLSSSPPPCIKPIAMAA